MDRIFVLGIGFNNVNMAEAVDKFLDFIKGDCQDVTERFCRRYFGETHAY